MVKMVCVDNSGKGYTNFEEERPMSHFLTRGRVYEGELSNGGYYFTTTDDTGVDNAEFDADRFQPVEEE